MLSHPDQYESYITEHKAELNLLKAVRRSARYEEAKGHSGILLELEHECLETRLQLVIITITGGG